MPRLPEVCPYEHMTAERWVELRSLESSLRVGALYELHKHLYGTPGAPRGFGKKAEWGLKEIGYEPIGGCVYLKTHESTPSQAVQLPSIPPEQQQHVRNDSKLPVQQPQQPPLTKWSGPLPPPPQTTTAVGEVVGVLYRHVDDFQGGGVSIEQDLRELSSRVELGEVVPLRDNVMSKFVGLEQLRVGDELMVGQATYLQGMDLESVVSLGRKRVVNAEDLVRPDEADIDLSLVGIYRALGGTAMWAVRTMPDRLVGVTMLLKYSTTPTVTLLRCLVLFLLGLRDHPQVLRFRGLRKGMERLVLFVDAAFCQKTQRARLGWRVLLVDDSWSVEQSDATNTIAWGTQAGGEVVASSTGGETLGFKLGCKEVWRAVYFCERLYGRRLPITAYTDSAVLEGQIESGVVKSEPRMQGHLDYILMNKELLGMSVVWINREYNLADILTKHIWWCPPEWRSGRN
jgi:hypothetical protein